MLFGEAFLPPSLIPALRNIGILHYKQAKRRKYLQHSVHTYAYLHISVTTLVQTTYIHNY